MSGRGALAGIALALLAVGCAEREAGAPTARASGGDYAQYDVTQAGKRYRIDVVAQSQGSRYIVVTSQGYRGVDRSEGAVAYAAVQQIAPTACEGAPMTVGGDTARFVDGDRSFEALTQGQPAWMFTGLCGG